MTFTVWLTILIQLLGALLKTDSKSMGLEIHSSAHFLCAFVFSMEQHQKS